MSNNDLKSVSHVRTDGGVAGKHPLREVHSALVGPATGEEFNVIELDFAPEACVRFDDVRFEFDSSFIGPESRTELQLLGQLRNEDPTRPASIFGHADPSGDDNYNKQLSGRRAQAMYGLLTRKTELWEELYKNPLGGDSWGNKSIQTMLKQLGFYEGSINGVLDAATNKAVRDFQSSPQGAGLTDDGIAGPKTREKLFLAYMDSICVDDKGVPFKLDPKTDFLAKGADSGGKGDFQGCSEFNPDMVFSKPEQQQFQQPQNKTERDRENKINRRVVVYLFRSGSEIKPQSWPCPRAKEGIAQCRTRFHADGDFRRTPRGEERRFFDEGGETFACNFYERIANLSPCEKPPPPETKKFCCKHRGTVVNNIDPNQMGRLQVRVPDVLGDQTPFAMPAVPYAGAGVGFIALPPVGANVWVDFEEGDAERPVWSGCFWGAGEFPAEAAGQPAKKIFKTENVTLIMDDTPGLGGFTVTIDAGGSLVMNANGIALNNARGSSITETGLEVSINQDALEVT